MECTRSARLLRTAKPHEKQPGGGWLKPNGVSTMKNTFLTTSVSHEFTENQIFKCMPTELILCTVMTEILAPSSTPSAASARRVAVGRNSHESCDGKTAPLVDMLHSNFLWYSWKYNISPQYSPRFDSHAIQLFHRTASENKAHQCGRFGSLFCERANRCSSLERAEKSIRSL